MYLAGADDNVIDACPEGQEYEDDADYCENEDLVEQNERVEGVIESMFDMLSDATVSGGLVSGQTPNEVTGGGEAREGAHDDPAGRADGTFGSGVYVLQDLLNPLLLFIVVAGVIIAVVRLLWYRRLDPMMDLMRSIITVIIATFAGLAIISFLVFFGDSLHRMLEDSGTTADDMSPYQVAAQVFPSILSNGMPIPGDNFITGAFRDTVMMLVGMAITLGAIIQIIIVTMVPVIIYIIAAVLPLAAASTMIPGVNILTKILGWLAACVLFKPVIILMYLVGLALLSNIPSSGSDEMQVLEYLVAAAVVLLATGALPMLMKLMGSKGAWLLAMGGTAMGGSSTMFGEGGAGGGGSGGGDDSGSGSSGANPTNASGSGGGNSESNPPLGGGASARESDLAAQMQATQQALDEDPGLGAESPDDVTPNSLVSSPVGNSGDAASGFTIAGAGHFLSPESGGGFGGGFGGGEEGHSLNAVGGSEGAVDSNGIIAAAAIDDTSHSEISGAFGADVDSEVDTFTDEINQGDALETPPVSQNDDQTWT